jgi:hypothetical protein
LSFQGAASWASTPSASLRDSDGIQSNGLLDRAVAWTKPWLLLWLKKNMMHESRSKLKLGTNLHQTQKKICNPRKIEYSSEWVWEECQAMELWLSWLTARGFFSKGNDDGMDPNTGNQELHNQKAQEES